MFDLSHSTCTSALHSPNTHGNLWLWPSDTLYDSYFTYRPRSNSNFDLSSGMEPTSPLSPTSAVTPTASEHTISPITPTPATKLMWPVSGTPTAVPRANTIILSPNTRRNTHHYAHTSPGTQTFAERMAHRSSKSLSLTLQQRRAFDLEMMPIKPAQEVVEPRIVDEDVQMLTPPPATPGESMVWEQTASSPILRRVVGLPLREHCEMAMRSLANSNPSHLHDTKTENPLSQPQRQSRSPSLSLRRRSSAHQRISTTNTEQPRHKSNHTIRKTLSSYPTQIHIPSARELHLQNAIRHLAIPLVPLISVVTGQAHPDFPRSVLQYHLLTHAQLDSLAIWYHQTIDNETERYMYPATISRPWTFSDAKMQARYGARSDSECVEIELGVKRRRFGRFMGLRGCESPVVEAFSEDEEEGEEEEDKADWDIDVDEEVNETVAEKMEREWRAALRRAEEEERLLEKVWRGRW